MTSSDSEGKPLEDGRTVASYDFKPDSLPIHFAVNYSRATPLVVSPVDVAFYLAQIAPGKMEFTPKAAHAVAALLEYLVAEILELSGNAARDQASEVISPKNITDAIRNDEELDAWFKELRIVWSLGSQASSYNRAFHWSVHGHTKEYSLPQVSMLPLDPTADLTVPVQPAAACIAQAGERRKLSYRDSARGH